MSFSMSDRIVEIGMLVGYLGLLLWIGIRTARRVQTANDFTVAGRSIPWVVIMATTAATIWLLVLLNNVGPPVILQRRNNLGGGEFFPRQ